MAIQNRKERQQIVTHKWRVFHCFKITFSEWHICVTFREVKFIFTSVIFLWKKKGHWLLGSPECFQTRDVINLSTLPYSTESVGNKTKGNIKLWRREVQAKWHKLSFEFFSIGEHSDPLIVIKFLKDKTEVMKTVVVAVTKFPLT